MPRIQVDGGAAFECRGDDTILRAALRAGVGFPYSCNVGSCGNCRFELLEGAVSHAREDAPAWTERDRRRGRWLGCQARPDADCRVRVRLDPACTPAHTPARMVGRLTGVTPLTHDMAEFAFALDGPDRFRPGQYALVTTPGLEAPRAYSMCNLPGEGQWRFQIKRVPGGRATTALFDALRPGDHVDLDGPYGQAWLREDQPRDLLLAAGGSGLSPMISIARAAALSPPLATREVHFVHGGRLPGDLCGEAMLAPLPGFGTRIRYTPCISEVEDAWTGRSGFVHDVVRALYGPRLAEYEIYFAGPSGMARAMQAMLHEAGVAPERVHFDEFY